MRRKTHDEFIKEVYDLVGDEYTVLGKYITTHTKIKMKHNKCGHEYEVKPNWFLCGRRCPNCFKSLKSNTEEFSKKVNKMYGDEYTVLGEYINNHTKIKMKHNKCGHEYEVNPVDFTISKHKCPKCARRIKLTTQDFIKEVYDLVGDEYTVLGEYMGNNKPLLIRHNLCGYEYNVERNHFINGNRCPNCNNINNSKGTRDIRKFLKENNIDFIEHFKNHNCTMIRNLEFDFFIKDLNLVIEYDGEQHFKNKFLNNSLDNQRKRDEFKNNWCIQNNIKILRISYINKDINSLLTDLILNKKFNDYLRHESTIQVYWKRETSYILL